MVTVICLNPAGKRWAFSRTGRKGTSFQVVCTVSATQVSRAAEQLDETLQDWRNRPLEEVA